MHLLDSLGGVHNFADQAALGKFLHRLPHFRQVGPQPEGLRANPFPCYSSVSVLFFRFRVILRRSGSNIPAVRR